MKEQFLNTSLTPSAFYDHDTFCWRMSQDTLLSGEPPLLTRLPNWGTTVDGVLYELPTPAHLINARDYLSGRNLPTLAARDHRDSAKKGPIDLTRQFPIGHPHSHDTLPRAIAHLLPTPTAGDCKSFGPNLDWEKRLKNHAPSVSSVLMSQRLNNGRKSSGDQYQFPLTTEE